MIMTVKVKTNAEFTENGYELPLFKLLEYLSTLKTHYL